MKAHQITFFTLLQSALLALSFGPVQASSAIINYANIATPVWASEGMVSSQQAIASQVGLDILKQGGNAVDAAVAVGFTLAVTLPRAGNLGGGGFMLVHLAKQNKTIAIDYREMAPMTAYRDVFLDAQGKVDKNKSRFHGLAVGVPGSVKGLTQALKSYGRLSLKQVMQPAIKLAENGFIVDRDLALSLSRANKRLSKWNATKRIFYHTDGSYYQVGELFVQQDLANTLKMIAAYGADGFYKGSVAQNIVASVNKAGGQMSFVVVK